MIGNLKRVAKSILSNFPLVSTRIEHRNQSYKINERSVEYAFALKCFSEIYPKKVLDVGTGTTAFPSVLRTCGALVDAIDNIKDYWPSGMINRHYYVKNENILEPAPTNKTYDMITCISVLEHIQEHEVAVQNMSARLKDGGYLCMSFPYTEDCYYQNCYSEIGSTYGQNNPYITQSFSRENVEHWCQQSGLKIIHQHYWKMWTGHVWTVGERITPPQMVEASEKHQICTILLQKI